MAATDRSTRRAFGAVILSACALPGVMVGNAWAEEAPDQGIVEIKVSGYKDAQDANAGVNAAAGSGKLSAQALRTALAAHGTVSAASGGGGGGGSGLPGLNLGSNLLNRITVTSPSVYALIPLGRQWSAEGSLTVDEISGASPAYYTDSKSFAHFKDRRTGVDATLTRYFERAAMSVGVATSTESDYTSNALSTSARIATPDQNTTLNLGLGLTRDINNPINQVVHNAHKNTNEYQIGITQALSPFDLVQIGYTRSNETGYLDDPYKLYEHRPGSRQANIVQTRWNHSLGGMALRTGYRYYDDSFGIRSHTVDLALAIPAGDDGKSTFTPSLRYYTQTAAAFYVNPNAGSASFPAPADQSGYYSLDQRLSAYGAVSVGAKYEWALAQTWSADAKFDLYRQQSSLYLGGAGSPGLAPLTAMIWQIGVKHLF